MPVPAKVGEALVTALVTISLSEASGLRGSCHRAGDTPSGCTAGELLRFRGSAGARRVRMLCVNAKDPRRVPSRSGSLMVQARS